MVKPIKSLRKQAEKAEAVANRISDPEIAGEMRALADAFRSQADAMKKKPKERNPTQNKR
jgi:hypothetical protein